MDIQILSIGSIVERTKDMLKKVTSFIGIGIAALLLICFGSVTAFADSNQSGEYNYTILNDNTVLITKYIGNGGDVTIPSVIDGHTVTQIGSEAFYDCINLTSVTIPDNVTSIDDRAFCKCTNLVAVNIGSGITEISEGLFLGCTNLTSITIPGNVEAIGYNAFRNCENLASVIICEGVKEIGENAFWNCTSLTEIYIPNSVVNIYFDYLPNASFSGCENLTIYCQPASYAADYARYLDINYYPRTSGSVSEGGIRYGIFDEEGIVSAFGYEYHYYQNLYYTSGRDTIFESEVTILSSQDGFIEEYSTVTSIWEYAFYNCTNLTSVIISDGIVEIGDKAFYGCENLTSVVIPDSVTRIGEDVFTDCPNLVIYVKTGSYAEQYADAHLLNYEIYVDKSIEKIAAVVIAIVAVVGLGAVLLIVLKRRNHTVVVHSEESAPLSAVNFCSSCGKQVDPDAAFCKYCGRKIQ